MCHSTSINLDDNKGRNYEGGLYMFNDNKNNENNNEYQFTFDDLDPFYEEALKKQRKNSTGKFLKSLAVFALFVAFTVTVSFGSVYIYTEHFAPASQSNNSTTQNTSQNTVTYLPTSTSDSLTTPQIYEKTINSVVAISTYLNQGGYQQAIGTGTGIIMSEDGYIITNAHVIEDGNQITVTLNDGTEYQAQVVGSDSKVDIAVIKVEATGLTAGNFGDSDSLVHGEPAIVIGNPLGMDFAGTITDGIISSTSREVKIDNYIMNLLQTNAAVNPGNSGGPLINCRGEIVGVVSAKISVDDVEGIGFAIPINTALNVANDFIEYGYVKNRPMLGISVEVVPELYAQFYGSQPGLKVVSVQDGSAADLAGIMPGDRIISFNGTEISTSAELDYEKDKYNIGDTVKITVLRENQEITLDLTLMENTSAQ